MALRRSGYVHHVRLNLFQHGVCIHEMPADAIPLRKLLRHQLFPVADPTIAQSGRVAMRLACSSAILPHPMMAALIISLLPRSCNNQRNERRPRRRNMRSPPNPHLQFHVGITVPFPVA